MADNFLINEGTQTTVASDDVSSVQYPRVKLDIGADGASSAFTGTLGAVTNLAGGTLGILTAGTLTALGIGTISVGTVLNIGLRHGDEFVGSSTLTGTATGTLRAAVTGSQIFVTTLIVSVESAGRVSVASGTPTIPLNGTMTFGANGGIAAMPIDPPLRTVSGSALVFNQSGTGVIGIFASGYID